MAATGTIALNANSLTVTGSGTKFTTEAQVGGALVTYIGNVPYTFVVGAINSDTSITLTANYQGSNVSGQSFSLIDRGAYTAITAELGARTAQAIRGLNYDKANWQQILTGSGNVTVNVPDGSQYTGPSWSSLANSLSNVNNSLNNKLGNDAATLRGLFTSKNNDVSPNWQYPGVSTYNDNHWGSPSQWGTILTMSNGDVSGNGASGRWYTYLQIDTAGNFQIAANINNSFIGAYKVYTTKNTSTNSSGALVPASPIVRIVNNKNNTRQDLLGTQNDEYTWQSDFGLTNDESEGCNVSKIETGKYLVTGASSLAKDLWQVMDCGNGQGRIIALAEAVETDSGIEVHCYKQKYTLSDDGDLTVERGDLIDIPDNTWIDVRLEMPDDSIWNKKQIQPTQDNAPTS